MTHYTQVLARTSRPTQLLGAVASADVYVFPYSRAGTVICEKTSVALDARIIVQVARGISGSLGKGTAVLAFAGSEDDGFWCGLFDGGDFKFRHNQITGARAFADRPASRAEVEILCSYFGPEVDREAVSEILDNGNVLDAVGRHAALARLLGLPEWSPGIGYDQVVNGEIPAVAGTPERPPRSIREFRGTAASVVQVEGSDSLAWFHETCDREFGFLEGAYGFEKASRQLVDHYPRVIDNVLVIGPGNLRPGYKNAYMRCYKRRDLRVVIEGLSMGAVTRLCLIDSSGRYLDFTRLVERRDPELLDLCRLASGQSEQIPIFAQALRESGSEILAGDLTKISPIKQLEGGFSFACFYSRADADYILALHGPRGRPRTILAQLRRFWTLRKVKARLRRSRKR